MAAAPQLATQNHRAQDIPCPGCGETVLLVTVAAEPLFLERREVVTPPYKCPWCDGRGCTACDQRGVRGEENVLLAIAVDERGRARRWRGGMRQRLGEGLHYPHSCSR